MMRKSQHGAPWPIVLLRAHFRFLCRFPYLAVVARIEERDLKPHDYIAYLHEGNDTWFNEEYSARHDEFFSKLQNAETESAGM